MTLTPGELMTVASIIGSAGAVGGGLAWGQRLILGEVRKINGRITDHLIGHPASDQIVVAARLDAMKHDADLLHASQEAAIVRLENRVDALHL